jgi:DNA replication and repair protein RecF
MAGSIGWLTPAMDRLFAKARARGGAFSTGWCWRSNPATPATPRGPKAPCANATACWLANAEPDPAWLDAIEAQLAEAGAAGGSGPRAAGRAAVGSSWRPCPKRPFARPALAYRPGGPLGATSWPPPFPPVAAATARRSAR